MKRWLAVAGSWTLTSTRAQRMFWQSLLVALVFYFSRQLAGDLAAKAEGTGLDGRFIHLLVFASVFLAVVSVFRGLLHLGEKVEQQLEQERATKAHAHVLCERAVVDETAETERVTEAAAPQSVAPNIARIQQLVSAAYQTFESAYGQTAKTRSRVDFEVTYMTRSLRDRYLTIAAAANKDGRKPRSMQLRDKTPEIYEATISADVFRAPGPRVFMIPSTATDQYKELYPEQKRRIRSSIVFPVVTPSNRLLGTLVVHCDLKNFFAVEREKYFCDLLEIFSKRIALEAVRTEQRVAGMSTENMPF